MLSTIGYYICVPFAALMRLFYNLTGSYGVAIILFTLVIKLILLPFQMKDDPSFEVGDYIYIPNVKAALDGDMEDIKAYVVGEELQEISLYIAAMTDAEKEIVKAGSLINFNRNRQKA